MYCHSYSCHLHKLTSVLRIETHQLPSRRTVSHLFLGIRHPSRASDLYTPPPPPVIFKAICILNLLSSLAWYNGFVTSGTYDDTHFTNDGSTTSSRSSSSCERRFICFSFAPCGTRESTQLGNIPLANAKEK